MRLVDGGIYKPGAQFQGAILLQAEPEFVKNALINHLLLPLPEPVIYCLPGTILLGQIPPGAARAQEPEKPVQHSPVGAAGSALVIRSDNWPGQFFFHQLPLPLT